MPKNVVKKDFVQSDELRDIAEKVMSEKGIDLSMAKIEYFLVYPNVSKKVAGMCVRTSRELKYFSEFDYLVEMSGDLWDNLSDEVRYLLMYHELMHIYPIYNEKKDEWRFSLRRHDIEDFRSIVGPHGVDWLTQVETIQQSLIDSENDKKKKSKDKEAEETN